MAATGTEPVGAMGKRRRAGGALEAAATPLLVLPAALRQGHEPADDAIREEIIMATEMAIGPEGNLPRARPDGGPPARAAFARAVERRAREDPSTSRRATRTASKTPHAADPLPGRRRRAPGSAKRSRRSETAPRRRSPRATTSSSCRTRHKRRRSPDPGPPGGLGRPPPSRPGRYAKLLSASSSESGEPREVHHFALLIGYGASAVNPYLAFETVHDQVRLGMIAAARPELAEKKYRKAIAKGIVKVISKMGISTIQELPRRPGSSSLGAQPGLRRRVLHGNADSHRAASASTSSPEK